MENFFQMLLTLGWSRVGWGAPAAGGRDIEVLLSGGTKNWKQGEPWDMMLPGDDCQTWLPWGMIAQRHNVAAGGWLPKMIISRNGLGRDDSLPKNFAAPPPPPCQRWEENRDFSITTDISFWEYFLKTSEGTINAMSLLTFWHMLCWVFE